MSERTDKHHILFSREEWIKRGNTRKARQSDFLRIKLDRWTHDRLHDVCDPVPVIGPFALEWTMWKVRKQFREELPPNPIDSFRNALEMVADHPSISPDEARIARLAATAIGAQIAFLESAGVQVSTNKDTGNGQLFVVGKRLVPVTKIFA